MTNNELKQLIKQYNVITTIKYDMDETLKEITNLRNINNNELKEMYFKIFPGHLLDEQELIVQEVYFNKIIQFVINYRENKLKKLQQQFNDFKINYIEEKIK